MKGKIFAPLIQQEIPTGVVIGLHRKVRTTKTILFNINNIHFKFSTLLCAFAKRYYPHEGCYPQPTWFQLISLINQYFVSEVYEQY